MAKREYWENDRSFELVREFADEETVTEAMKMWLGLDDTIDANTEHVQEAFEGLEKSKRYEILVDYIEEVGLVWEYCQWYADKYELYDDGDDDSDAGYDDEKYERQRDLNMDFHGIFDTMGLDGEGVQQAWDRMIARGGK